MRAYLFGVFLAAIPLARHYVPIFFGWDEPPYLIKDNRTPIDLRIRFLIEPSVRENIQLVIMVNSLPHNSVERQRIRDSWAREDLYDVQNTKVLFLTGKPADIQEEQLLMIEGERFQDMVVTDIEEDYYSLSLKTFHKAKCLVKADSDNVLLIPNYERLCDEIKVKRDRTKWMVPESVYPHPTFPKYCSTGTYILCGHDIPARLMAAANKSWFPLSANYRKLPEDVLFTGIFAEIANIRRTHIGGMSFIDAPEYICRGAMRAFSLHMNRVRNPSFYLKRLKTMEGHVCPL
ncbi:hypothetical protein RB195_003322 [Necator americanus]|uniref:Hexosyltransferase n=1 Tax=Necator americanus TaxID=51031 RepID=A0ABR1DN16_NECAM